MKIKKILIGMFLLVVCLSFVSASYCCEKTSAGAWCMNVDEKKDCDLTLKEDGSYKYLNSQTGCESTTYCSFGTCINNKEGTCSANTAQKTCDKGGGIWKEESMSELSQCEEGCCVLGTTSFFDTLTRCKKESAAFGLETDFRKNVDNELECSELVTSDVKGACVFEKGEDLGKTCKFISKKECSDMEDTTFYEKTLCTSEELGTTCERSTKTKCSNGNVYFLENCGNLANIFDASKKDDNYYWTRVVDIGDVECDNGLGNINSGKCGVCDYLAGSTCVDDKICADMNCRYKNKDYKHGEKWCAGTEDGNKGVEKSLPGSEHFVLGCDEGEVDVVEECREWRNLICVEEEVQGFSNAGCVANRWQDCTAQDNEKDCLNEDVRKCSWVKNEFSTTWSNLKCVPKYAPAVESEVDCSVGTATCKVTYEKKLGRSWEPAHNTYCLENRWANKMNQVCNALGDCGMSVNYQGQKGWYEMEDLFHK